MAEYLTILLSFIAQWWGLILILFLFGAYAIYDYEAAKKKIVGLIFIAEERAREKALETGKQKFDWVVFNGYRYLPVWLRLVMSEELFAKLVQSIFDGIVQWAEKQKIREEQTEGGL